MKHRHRRVQNCLDLVRGRQHDPRSGFRPLGCLKGWSPDRGGRRVGQRDAVPRGEITPPTRRSGAPRVSDIGTRVRGHPRRPSVHRLLLWRVASAIRACVCGEEAWRARLRL